MQAEVISDRERRIVGRIVRALWFRDRTGGPWALPNHLRADPIAFEGNTGASIAGLWFEPPAARGVVVLAHPDRRYAKHWFVRSGWVDFLLSNGYAVLTFDFAGYGESVGPATYYHEDVLAAVDFARKCAPHLPLHVVGVSLGAFAAANASPRLDGVESLILESPYTSFGDWYGGGFGTLSLRAFSVVFPRTARSIQADDNIARAKPRRILVVLAEDDEVTRPELTEVIAGAAPADRTRLLRVAGARHLEPFDREPSYRAQVLDMLAAGGDAEPASEAHAPVAAVRTLARG